MKLTKNQAKPKQHPDAKPLLFENCSLSMLSSKNNIFLQNVQKNKCICFNVMWLMTMKMRLKKKNWWHNCDTNRSRPRHGHKYTKY